MTHWLRALVLGCLAAWPMAAAAQTQPPTRAITQIRGDLWRFQNNFHYSVFLVTPDGIIATDPINADAAAWLKAEIKTRFDKPIRYVIYSHDHWDHIAGGEVFARDGAVVIAHENAKRAIVGEKRPTAVPNLTFRDAMTLELGGKTVELLYVGRNHSDNSLVLRFPAERTIFAVDFIPVKALAFRDFPDAYLPDWMESLARVEMLDFDTLAPGHGPLGSKADVTAFKDYLLDLHGQVLAQVRAGKSLEETRAAVDLGKYKDWGQYEAYAPLNVAGMYTRLRMQHVPNPR